MTVCVLVGAALYLVSDDSAGITGITHVIDGGLLAAAEYRSALRGNQTSQAAPYIERVVRSEEHIL